MQAREEFAVSGNVTTVEEGNREFHILRVELLAFGERAEHA